MLLWELVPRCGFPLLPCRWHIHTHGILWTAPGSYDGRGKSTLKKKKRKLYCTLVLGQFFTLKIIRRIISSASFSVFLREESWRVALVTKDTRRCQEDPHLPLLPDRSLACALQKIKWVGALGQFCKPSFPELPMELGWNVEEKWEMDCLAKNYTLCFKEQGQKRFACATQLTGQVSWLKVKTDTIFNVFHILLFLLISYCELFCQGKISWKNMFLIMSKSHSVVSYSLQTHGLQPTRLSVHGTAQARISE